MACEGFAAIQQALARSSDHSASVEEAHYAIKFGDIRRLSNFTVWEARWIIQQWWAILGLGGEPPKPIRERQVLNEEDLNTKVHRVVETSVQAAMGPIVTETLKELKENMRETMKSMAPEIISYLAQLYQQSSLYPLSLPTSSIPSPSKSFPDPALLDSPTLKRKTPTSSSPPRSPPRSPQAKRPRLDTYDAQFNAMFNTSTSADQGLQTQYTAGLSQPQPQDMHCDLWQDIGSQYGVLPADLDKGSDTMWGGWDECSI